MYGLLGKMGHLEGTFLASWSGHHRKDTLQVESLTFPYKHMPTQLYIHTYIYGCINIYIYSSRGETAGRCQRDVVKMRSILDMLLACMRICSEFATNKVIAQCWG